MDNHYRKQRPNVSSATGSRPLAAAVAPSIFGSTTIGRRPSVGRSDLAVTTFGSPLERLIAVKGTGAARWITLTLTDMEASCLLWVDYTERIASLRGPVELWIFDRPLADWAYVGRATLRQTVRRYGSQPRRLLIDLDFASRTNALRAQGG